jgi:hypothetical protein
MEELANVALIEAAEQAGLALIVLESSQLPMAKTGRRLDCCRCRRIRNATAVSRSMFGLRIKSYPCAQSRMD